MPCDVEVLRSQGVSSLSSTKRSNSGASSELVLNLRDSGLWHAVLPSTASVPTSHFQEKCLMKAAVLDD